jgi:hypothetical protein
MRKNDYNVKLPVLLKNAWGLKNIAENLERNSKCQIRLISG